MTYQQSVFKHYHSDRHFSQFYLQDGGKKPTGIDMEQNYVTVTLHIRRHLYAEHKMRPIRTDVAWSVSVRGGARVFCRPGQTSVLPPPPIRSAIDILMVTTMTLVWSVTNITLSWGGCNYVMQTSRRIRSAM